MTSEDRQVFPFPRDQVLDALADVIGPAGFEGATRDPVRGRIVASAGISGTSWGEQIIAEGRDLAAGSSELVVRSTPFLGWNYLARYKSRRNVQRLLSATHGVLHSPTRDVARAVADAPSLRMPLAGWVVMACAFGFVLVLAYRMLID